MATLAELLNAVSQVKQNPVKSPLQQLVERVEEDKRRQAARNVEIGSAGESHVGLALRLNGYQVTIDTKGPGCTDVVAVKNTHRMLIQVKTSEHPNLPACLTGEEEIALKARAKRQGCNAYEATLQLNNALEPLGQISWRELS
ncbi:MAG TPA: hypothetical protein PLN21_07705 [Gemmatales bacterium]|nr:hypothetical protein [Gemmatales bacterium]